MPRVLRVIIKYTTLSMMIVLFGFPVVVFFLFINLLPSHLGFFSTLLLVFSPLLYYAALYELGRLLPIAWLLGFDLDN